MQDLIQQEVLNLLPARKKKSGDWISFNAVCCVHNSETPDTRGRGGMRPNADGSVSYHCFNCGFKTGFYPGRPMGFKFRKLLSWLGADNNTVQRLVMEALRIKDLVPVTERVPVPEVEVTYKPRPLPENSATILEWATMIRLGLPYNEDGTVEWKDLQKAVPQQLTEAVEYLHQRKIDIKKYDFYITDEEAYNLHKRVIIPFYWKDKIIGYTARAIEDDVKPKYHNNHDPNFVFNMNNQLATSKFVLVMEGPFDAMSIDGVAILGNECSDVQADIIESLGREVIVVPDFDAHVNPKNNKKVWAGKSLVDAAVRYHWSVSFPIWAEEYKDVASAVEHLGKLFVLKSILDARETNAFKIELKGKAIYNKL
jgi:hypothetical protein